VIYKISQTTFPLCSRPVPDSAREIRNSIRRTDCSPLELWLVFLNRSHSSFQRFGVLANHRPNGRVAATILWYWVTKKGFSSQDGRRCIRRLVGRSSSAKS
jgi:hypothetical protein